MKKIERIIFLLTVLVLAAAIPEIAHAETKSGICGENGSDTVTWTLSDAGVLQIEGTGRMDAWDTQGSDEAVMKWQPRSDIREIIVKEGVTNISENAFQFCENLTKVTLPGSVTEIEDMAFLECTSLSEILIPGSVKTIGFNVFDGCSSLRTITLQNGIETIRGGVFNGCTNLKSVVFPDSVKTLENVFLDNTEIEKVILPNGLQTISYNLFEGCTSLTSVVIPDKVSVIGQGAFLSCESLKSITIPASVNKIEEDVFKGCTSLESVKFLGDLPSISATAFSKVNAVAYYPEKWKKVPAKKGFGGKLIWVPYNKKTGKTGESPNPPKLEVIAPGKELAGGISIQLTVPPGYDKTKVEWEVSDPDIAKISKTGKLKIKKNAPAKTITVTIRYKTAKGKLRTAKIKIKKVYPATKMKVKGKRSIKAGKKIKLTVSVNRGASKKVTWKSSRKDVSVSKKGLVKTKKTSKGSVVITAVSTDGYYKKANFKIAIK